MTSWWCWVSWPVTTTLLSFYSGSSFRFILPHSLVFICRSCIYLIKRIPKRLILLYHLKWHFNFLSLIGSLLKYGHIIDFWILVLYLWPCSIPLLCKSSLIIPKAFKKFLESVHYALITLFMKFLKYLYIYAPQLKRELNFHKFIAN